MPAKLRDVDVEFRRGASFGVYVHVPFCASRCDYCAFATWTDRSHLMEEYADACVRDLERRYREREWPAATSVFFGGGTPSLMPAKLLMSILDAVPTTGDAEVTVECNPDSVTADALAVYRAHGVTRISLGVQSMNPHVLTALGRTHAPANVGRAVTAVRDAGFSTFNLDLIYGAADETFDDWRRTVDAALGLDPPHLSAYALTVEPGTPLARRIGDDREPAPDDDDQATKYEALDRWLEAAGFRWCEISNWSRPGHECRHNLLYWRGGEYLAIGCAAHGHTEGRRWWTVRTPERYIEAVRRGQCPVAASESIDRATREEERIMLGLRTRAGIVAPPHPTGVTADMIERGFLEPGDGRVRLTRKGRLLASEIAVRLLGSPAG